MSDTASGLPGAIALLDRILSWAALILGGATLAFMTVFSTWNVLIMRKALNSPIIGAEDLLVLSLVVIVALSVALGARTGAHIEIEILESRMSAAFAKWSMVLVKTAGIAVLTIMSWQLWRAGDSAARFGETTQQLLISFGPFYYLLAVSIGIYAVVMVLDIWQLVRSGRVIRLKVDGDQL